MGSWDIVLLIILSLGTYRGYQKGLLREVVALVAFVVAVVGALQLLSWGTLLLSEKLQTESSWLPILAFLMLFVAILLGVTAAGRMMKSAIDLTPLGFLDGLAGALLGAFKWAFGISLILLLLDHAEVELPAQQESTLYSYVHPFALTVIDRLEEWFPIVEELVGSLNDLFRSNIL